MELEVILFCCIFGLFIMASYTLGLRNGQKLAKREEIKLPDVNPVNIVNKQIEIKEEKKEQEEWEKYIDAMEAYDGRI